MSRTLNIKPGDTMPDFELSAHAPGPDGTGGGERVVRLSELLGSPFVLFFYPRANTPGCTREARLFRDLLPLFYELGAQVFGASSDALRAQERFCVGHGLNMPLLSDTNGRYRALLGNPDDGDPTSRITYVVDAEGVVSHVFGVPRIDAVEHARRALDAVQNLSAPA